jgi:hypothetical protein
VGGWIAGWLGEQQGLVADQAHAKAEAGWPLLCCRPAGRPDAAYLYASACAPEAACRLTRLSLRRWCLSRGALCWW